MTKKESKLFVNRPLASVADAKVREPRGSQPTKSRAQKWSSVRGAGGTHCIQHTRRNWTTGAKLTPARLKRVQALSDHNRGIPVDINEYVESLRKYSA